MEKTVNKAEWVKVNDRQFLMHTILCCFFIKCFVNTRRMCAVVVA